MERFGWSLWLSWAAWVSGVVTTLINVDIIEPLVCKFRESIPMALPCA